MNFTNNEVLSIRNFLISENKNLLIKEIFEGLSKEHKQLSSRFFYDDNGSELFEQITALPEYYPTRTEKSIISENAKAIVGDFSQLDIIELGSGDCSKISILLNSIPEQKIRNVRYFPVDVSESAILKSADMLSLKYKNLTIHGLLADFMKHLIHLPSDRKRLICFFGSTIGNLTPKQSADFLHDVARQIKPGDRFLLGLDMEKDQKILNKAYNDGQGITALFNKNILNVVNETTGTNFNPDHFDHWAYFNLGKSQIEMHLKAKKDLIITSKHFPAEIRMNAGETIHTENSRKFSLSDIHQMATISGLEIEQIFTDPAGWFSLVLLDHQILHDGNHVIQQ